MNKQDREVVLRLFQQLHQSADDVDSSLRANGNRLCEICGLAYIYHPIAEEFSGWGYDFYDSFPSKRLCDGTVVHL